MSTTEEMTDAFTASWTLTASVPLDAPADRVYQMVSDITRMGEWSPECYGGSWISGSPGRPGARFHGFNREHDAEWTSECEVVTAEPAREFGFTVLAFCAGKPSEDTTWVGGSQPGDQTWTFEIREDGAGCVLTQVHTMKLVSPFYRMLLEEVAEDERADSVRTRREHLQHSMESTLAKIKAASEQSN
jgi:polyketide cyclase/dehydrase/lipid transport protein